MIKVKNGDVTTKWIVYARDSTTLQGATGKASTLGSNAYIGKQGGSLAAVTGTFTEDDATKAPGQYLYTPGSGETNTNGPIRMTTAAASGVVIMLMVPVQVVAYDPNSTVVAQVWDPVKNVSPVAGSYGEDMVRPGYTVVTGTLSTTQFTITGNFGTNVFVGSFIRFLSGANAQFGPFAVSADADALTLHLFTVGTMPNAPSNGDRLQIVNG